MPAKVRDTYELLIDKVEGLDADLFMAVGVAYRRGAVEWTRANYPAWYERFAAEGARAESGS